MASSLVDVLTVRALSTRVAIRTALAVCDTIESLHSAYPFVIHGNLRVSSMLMMMHTAPLSNN